MYECGYDFVFVSVQKWADLRRLLNFGVYVLFLLLLRAGVSKKVLFFFLCTYHDFALTLDDNFSFLLCCFAFFC